MLVAELGDSAGDFDFGVVMLAVSAERSWPPGRELEGDDDGLEI